jgi:hypothetical protein
MPSAPLDRLLDRLAIGDVVHQYATAVDTRDWPLFRACFTDRPEFDLSSWNGVPAARIPADVWVEGVCAGLSGFDATQHVSANHVVDQSGDQAHCTSHMQARHVIDGECYTLGGHYDNEVLRTDAGWCIDRCRLTITWHEGPRELMERAAARWAEKSGSA